MKRFLLTLVCCWTAWFATAAEPASAGTLTLDTYLKLSIERLELCRSCWYWDKQSPTPVQLQVLWKKYKTTEKDFLRFGSRNGKEIDAYLAQKPAIRKRIDQLSAEVREYIQQKKDANVPN